MKTQKIIDFIIIFFFAWVFSTCIHEFCHYIVAVDILHAQGVYVTFSGFLTGACFFPTPFHFMWFAYLAGGLGTGIMFLMLGFRAVKTPTKWDADEAFIYLLFGGLELGYGVSEMSLATSFAADFWWLSIMGCIIGALPLAIWRAPKLVDFFMEKEAT